MDMTNVFLKILHMSATASWLVLAVVFLRQILKKAPKWIHCALWAMVALRLICPVTLESELSLVPAEITRAAVEEAMDDYVGNTHVFWDITEEYESAVDAGLEPVYGEEGGFYVVTGETPEDQPTVFADRLAPAWLVGMVAMAGYAGFTYFRLKKRVRASISLAENLYLCDYIDTPFILGVVKPKIYLPSAMEPNAASHVLAHERAHIRRRDHWWKPLGFLLLTIHWFNPVMWLAYILLCRDIELACDEKVIREMGAVDKKAYSEALLACSVPRHMVAACPLAFGEVGVKERVKTVLNYKKPAFWVVLVAVVLCIVVAVCFLTDPKESESVNEPAPTVSTEATEERLWGEDRLVSMEAIYRGSPYRWLQNMGENGIEHCYIILCETQTYSRPLEGSEYEELIQLLKQVEEDEIIVRTPEGENDALWNLEGVHIWFNCEDQTNILLRYVEDTIIVSPETDSGIWETDGYWTIIENKELRQWLQKRANGGTHMLSEKNREEIRQLLKMDFVEFFDPQSYEDMLFVGCSYDHARGLGVACFQANDHGGYDLLKIIRGAEVHTCESGSLLYYCDYNGYKIHLVLNESVTAIEWKSDNGFENRCAIDRHPAVVINPNMADMDLQYRFCYGHDRNTTMYMDENGVVTE